MPLWLTVLLIFIATHRLTRIISRDAIPLISLPRDAFVRRWGGFSDAKTRDERRMSLTPGKNTNPLMRSLAYLWECDWCMSVWVGGVLSYAGWCWTALHNEHWFVTVLVALSASSFTGLIAQREPD